ncbi:hypothetical protein QTP70_012262 [Hemibagrus guttatus]|uniref:Uncharacterized protein n=1 Tax=Hemibagrus guttatus TaxID=175788 RepID=A0AAE0UPK1_9TELE|nr:hypothetical protein QTP70_012262 [Hemibagrus guttatus]
MYPESTTDSPARLSLRQPGSPGMIYRPVLFKAVAEPGSVLVPDSLSLYAFCIPKPAGPGSGVRKSRSSSSGVGEGGGRMLSMSYSESIRSGISRYHSDQGLNQAPRQTNQSELQRLREQRAAAHVKNMEDFLKMNGLTLEECVSFQTGMKYRFSMGFRSGESAGQSSTPTPWSFNPLLVLLAVWAVPNPPGNEISIFKKLVSRRKHEVLQNFLGGTTPYYIHVQYFWQCKKCCYSSCSKRTSLAELGVKISSAHAQFSPQ